MEEIIQEYQLDIFGGKNLTDSNFSINEMEIASIRQALFTGRTLVKAWAKSLNPKERKLKGQAFIHQLISKYWSYNFNGHLQFINYSHSDSFPKNDRTISALANSLALSASVLDVNEACYHIGLLYTLILSESERSENGVFYTPPNLVSLLYSRIAEQETIEDKSILDPACGSGIFLVAAVSKISGFFKKSADVINHIEKNIEGWEIDPFAAWLAQIFIEVALKEHLIKTKRHLKSLVIVGNSLEIGICNKRKFNLVIGNPPYGKISLSPFLRQNYAQSLYGHANLYGVFMNIALNKVEDNGFIAYVTPTSYLAGEYFKALRNLFSTNTISVNFDFVTARKDIFEDVLQETVLSVFQKTKLKVNSFCKVYEIEPYIDKENKYSVSEKFLGKFGNVLKNSDPWILPKRESQKSIISNFDKTTYRLKDWGYEINTGQLVWNRHKTQLKSQPGKERYSLVWAESISPDGTFALKASKRNHAPFIEVRKKEDFLITRQACVLAQRTTSKEQNKRLITAVLPNNIAKKGVVIENHVNIIKPVNAKVDLEVLSAFLNSRVVDEIFRCLSGSVAVSAYELESIPLPNYSALKRLNNLVINKADYSEIEKEISRLYKFK